MKEIAMNARAFLLPAALLCSSIGVCAQTIPADTDFRVRLLVPISTETNKKGDKITAQVLSPDGFKGDVMEGKVNRATGGGKVKGESVLNFSFTTLNHAGKAVPVQSSVKSVVNSQGQANVDEEGQVVRKKNNLGKVALATGAGALIGALAGGGKGAAIGAGIGAAASLIFIEVAVKGANVSFAPGSEFLLSVKERQ
jgi:hypothetical protein